MGVTGLKKEQGECCDVRGECVCEKGIFRKHLLAGAVTHEFTTFHHTQMLTNIHVYLPEMSKYEIEPRGNIDLTSFPYSCLGK